MTSPSYRRVGLTQFLLALGFVIWLVFLPGYANFFAWPIGSRLSSMFIGTCFALRCFEGFRMWREPNWSRLRWMSWGTMAFLTVIFIATYWHVDLINWQPFNIMAWIWVIAYTAEPLVIPFVEPHGEARLLARRARNLWRPPDLPHHRHVRCRGAVRNVLYQSRQIHHQLLALARDSLRRPHHLRVLCRQRLLGRPHEDSSWLGRGPHGHAGPAPVLRGPLRRLAIQPPHRCL